MNDGARIFGLPHLPQKVFNRLATQLAGKNAPTWTDAGKKDDMIQPHELKARSRAAGFVRGSGDNLRFTQKFERLYRKMAETYRQELVTSELGRVQMKELRTDFNAWIRSAPKAVGMTAQEIKHYKTAMRGLLQVGPYIERAFAEQSGYSDTLRAEPKNANDTELLYRYNNPWCIGDSNPFCNALPSLTPRQNTTIASGIACSQLGEDTMTLASPFMTVSRGANGKPKPTPYAETYAAVQKPAAEELRKIAAVLAKIPREKITAQYLFAVADAFESTKPFPYAKSDALWIQHKESNAILLLRIGADENYEDPCEVKAFHQMFIALKDFASSTLTDKFKPYAQDCENYSAALIDNPADYVASKATVKMPDMVNVVYAVGDSRGTPTGTTIGQTLPNWCGDDGKAPCTRRTMIFLNKIAAVVDQPTLAKFYLPLFAPKHHAEILADFGPDTTVLHELMHNFGPSQSKTHPTTGQMYGKGLKKAAPAGSGKRGISWSGTTEELKANNGAYDLPGYLRSQGHLDDKWYRIVMLKNLVYTIKKVMQGARTVGTSKFGAYNKLSLVQFGSMIEYGGIRWNDKGQIEVDFKALPAATKRMSQETLKLYAKNAFDPIDQYYAKYHKGPGFDRMNTKRILQVMGNLPSVNIRYVITGLDL